MRHLRKTSIRSGIIATSLLIGTLPHVAYAAPVAAPLHCTIDAGRFGKTVQDTHTTFDVSLPEKVTAVETFVAKFKLSDVTIHNDTLKKIGSIKMEKSAINLHVGDNVQLAEPQPGLTISNGILTISDKLTAALHRDTLTASAPELNIKLRATGGNSVVFATTKEVTTGTVRARVFIFSATAHSSCTTTPDVQLASATVVPGKTTANNETTLPEE
ncbi:hypothetical protein [Corynebacterium silvaticum]|uniref:DIP2116-like N-terminal domain-containing protein n=1 Tax=Corynebacterium silvaticum TaxID=2320431 RepID=A0A7Y4P7W6_9CORY|nr:hypothetical protein [Corynebacterium silvaticum]ARU46855.1 hypothetical protein CBE74_10830 [Corynebacterium silvaticum]MBH5300752.1 hypothetical protein [Corynebacterium silvaticum]NOM64951.1 hypothetical protein [Corynebacterium silvaticum]NON70168.1 hypothetical protein [Corynebacterium silvaticum]TFA91438.1 hypothetical protein EU802_10950 [Corynebacterium silvaticum]